MKSKSIYIEAIMEYTIRIGGMMSPFCTKRVKKALLKVKGCRAAEVDFTSAAAVVEGDAPLEAYEKAIINEGYILVKYEE